MTNLAENPERAPLVEALSERLATRRTEAATTPPGLRVVGRD